MKHLLIGFCCVLFVLVPTYFLSGDAEEAVSVEALPVVCASNNSVATLCAEEDNVNIPLTGTVESFIIEALHPSYTVGTDNCNADFTNCNAARTAYAFTPGVTKIWDDGTTAVEVVTDAQWWRPSGMSVTVNGDNMQTDVHYIRVYGKIADAYEWPQFFVLYQDGNMRLIPHPPAGSASVCFGSSVVVGPAAVAERPFVDIASVNYHSEDQALTVIYSSGGYATFHLDDVNRARARVRVDVDYDTTTLPFATFRSMFVATGNTDVDSVSWKDGSGANDEDIMDFTNGESGEWLFYRKTRSQHNTSAPDIRITVFKDINVTSPDGGEYLGVRENHTINWTVPNLTGNVSIDLYKGETSVYHIGDAAANAGGFIWALPAGFNWGRDYRVRISQNVIEDYSDNYFSIGFRGYYVFHGGDYDGNGSADIAVFRPSNGRWCIMGNPSTAWGTASDIPVPGDYDGNGTTDVAIFRPSTGRWCIMGQPSVAWGTAGDVPVPGDYDGNGTTDMAIYRPSNGRWCVMGQPSVAWGAAGDIPVPGDYDGNGTTDMAIFRPTTGRWCVKGNPSVAWGTATDVLVPGDYDGNGTTDMAIFRPSTGRWCVMGSASQAWGTANDIPVPADYDGNGTCDIAIFRPETGTWAVKGTASQRYGTTTDIPLISHWK
ncbi:MAG: hypothetical protein GY765_09850 [bacterium]|nr:hypothetical protein [bacterium]